MRFRLVCFDLDGVLTDHISSWVWVHDHFGVSNEDSYQAFVRGEIDDMEFMRRDIALWKHEKPGITAGDVEAILRKVPVMKGARELINALREEGTMTGIISGGIDLLARRVAQRLRMDFFVANGMEYGNDGNLTGEGILKVPLRDKASVVKGICAGNGFKMEDIAAVGDTYIDIPMMETSGFGIAFNPYDDRIIEAADAVVGEKDLSLLIPLLTQHSGDNGSSNNTMEERQYTIEDLEQKPGRKGF